MLLCVFVCVNCSESVKLPFFNIDQTINFACQRKTHIYTHQKQSEKYYKRVTEMIGRNQRETNTIFYLMSNLLKTTTAYLNTHTLSLICLQTTTPTTLK